MAGALEIRAFIWLSKLFADRGWSNPLIMPIEGELSGPALLRTLDVPEGEVESLIVNRRVVGVRDAVLKPGDRVALVPPGVPGPHRFLLGLHHPPEHDDGPAGPTSPTPTGTGSGDR